MRKLFTIMLCVLLTASVFSQAPQKMSYQSVIRNNSDQLVTNQTVGMQISILQGSASGTVVYSEIQTPMTNSSGLVSIEIGGGAGFDAIDWANGPYFIKTETDPTGSTSYTITGISQLLSVPYALYASNFNIIKNGRPWDFYVADNGNLMALPKITVEYPYGAVPTVTDHDGNVYNTVKIGTQVWMAENLKTTKYNDNTAIPLVTDNSEWISLTTPAYCWYDNDISNKTTYGALYNWYTVNTGKLCPTGWHVPSDEEWTILTNYLGSMAGGRMRETGTTHWKSPNTDAPNDSKFTALPGGSRRYDGSFYYIGDGGYWWSATEDDAADAWYLNMEINSFSTFYGSYYYKYYGISVRCLRD